jgi:hypothetical protein
VQKAGETRRQQVNMTRSYDELKKKPFSYQYPWARY